MRKGIQKELSWVLTKYNDEGISYAALADDARRRFLRTPSTATETPNSPTPYCDPKSDGVITTASVGGISLEAGGGPIVISVLTTAAALLVFFVYEWRRGNAHKTAADPWRLLLEAPTLRTRFKSLLGMSKAQKEGLKGTGGSDTTVKDTTSTAYKDDDVKLLAQMHESRSLTNQRAMTVGGVRAGEPLTLSDVPLLLRLIRRAADGGNIDGFSAALPTLNTREKVEARLRSKHGTFKNLTSSFVRASAFRASRGSAADDDAAKVSA